MPIEPKIYRSIWNLVSQIRSLHTSSSFGHPASSKNRGILQLGECLNFMCFSNLNHLLTVEMYPCYCWFIYFHCYYIFSTYKVVPHRIKLGDVRMCSP